MYKGQGLPAEHFAAQVVFEDPVAKCIGLAEVKEAFRALIICSPEAIAKPWLVVNTGQEREFERVYVGLHQRYFGFLEVRSIAVVDFEQGPKGLVKRVEERWNGHGLVDWTIFGIVRRMNGIISYGLTRVVV